MNAFAVSTLCAWSKAAPANPSCSRPVTLYPADGQRIALPDHEVREPPGVERCGLGSGNGPQFAFQPRCVGGPEGDNGPSPENGQSETPKPETRAHLEPTGITPQDQICLLQHVVGLIRIAQQRQDIRIQPPLMFRHQLHKASGFRDESSGIIDLQQTNSRTAGVTPIAVLLRTSPRRISRWRETQSVVGTLSPSCMAASGFTMNSPLRPRSPRRGLRLRFRSALPLPASGPGRARPRRDHFEPAQDPREVRVDGPKIDGRSRT